MQYHGPDESNPVAFHSAVADAGLEQLAARLALNRRPTRAS
jgi:hypothetical protein